MSTTLAEIARETQAHGTRRRCILLEGLGNGPTERAALLYGVRNGHVVLEQGTTRDMVWVPLADAEMIGAEFA